MIAILGGTAAYHLRLGEFGEVREALRVETPWGTTPPLVPLRVANKGEGITVLFASRHGEGELARSAAFVNHRALLWALRAAGARAVLSWNGVGAIAPGLAVGDIVVPDDLLDRSRARVSSFGPTVTPSQPTESGPFASTLRRALAEAACARGERVWEGGTYLATEGPRLETAAEISAAAWDGAAVVGMTLAPEVWLAQALGLPFASLALVTNRATGTGWRDQRRDFSPRVGERAMRVMLDAAGRLEREA